MEKELENPKKMVNNLTEKKNVLTKIDEFENSKIELTGKEVDWICKQLGNLSKLLQNPIVTSLFDNESYFDLQIQQDEINEKRLELMRKLGVLI
ncbi:MAG: hypothetical protein ACXABI_05150 [Candidatus Hodarchaeales archaeon]